MAQRARARERRRQPREVIRDVALDGLEVVELRRHFSHAGRPATDAACLYVGGDREGVRRKLLRGCYQEEGASTEKSQTLLRESKLVRSWQFCGPFRLHWLQRVVGPFAVLIGRAVQGHRAPWDPTNRIASSMTSSGQIASLRSQQNASQPRRRSRTTQRCGRLLGDRRLADARGGAPAAGAFRL